MACGGIHLSDSGHVRLQLPELVMQVEGASLQGTCGNRSLMSLWPVVCSWSIAAVTVAVLRNLETGFLS